MKTIDHKMKSLNVSKFQGTEEVIRNLLLQTLLFFMPTILALVIVIYPVATAANESLHIAVGDTPGVNLLNLLTVMEHTKQRGVKVRISYMQSEDIAFQAVLIGQADIGVGAPYGAIQGTSVPIRMFYQLSTLRFFPVVNTKFFKTWKDLDGAEIYTAFRGSGTEAIMNLMAKKNGIKYKSMNYVASSSVRARAMLEGRINATIVDSQSRSLLMEEGKGRFAVLPIYDLHASDETLYANISFLKHHEEAIDILLEELLKVWRKVNNDPHYMITAMRKYNLLSELSTNNENDVLSYYTESVSAGMFPNNGGSLRAVKDDFEFYSFAGTIKGGVSRLEVDDFWNFDPLNKVLDKLGSK